MKANLLKIGEPQKLPLIQYFSYFFTYDVSINIYPTEMKTRATFNDDVTMTKSSNILHDKLMVKHRQTWNFLLSHRNLRLEKIGNCDSSWKAGAKVRSRFVFPISSNYVESKVHLKIAPQLEGVTPQLLKWGAVMHLRKNSRTEHRSSIIYSRKLWWNSTFEKYISHYQLQKNSCWWLNNHTGHLCAVLLV